jgi:hypothetical protein
MKTFGSTFAMSLLALFMIVFTSCKREDVGPYQEEIQNINFSNFKNLQMGDAFRVTVKQSSIFSITVRGDRRNLDDLEIKVDNNTLVARYRNHRNRQYETHFDITMPSLNAVDFSGASHASISGFSGSDKFYLTLSGASHADINVQANYIGIGVSGASTLDMTGKTQKLEADASGASRINGFNMSGEEVKAEASGASGIYITAGKTLDAKATGASKIRYRGNPSVNANSSGASSIQKD